MTRDDPGRIILWLLVVILFLVVVGLALDFID